MSSIQTIAGDQSDSSTSLQLEHHLVMCDSDLGMTLMTAPTGEDRCGERAHQKVAFETTRFQCVLCA